MERLVLFDIDKTLIKSSKFHRQAFSAAFRKVYKLSATIDLINGFGMTDQQIITEVLKLKGLSEGEIKPKLNECMDAMVEYYLKHLAQEQVVVLDYVRDFLEELSKQDILLGLVTGNLEQIAWGKLEKAGLRHYFMLGGFGSDDMNRANLAMLAIIKAQKLGLRPDGKIFLFGDAPQDMAAGKAAGIKTIGVTTGFYSKEQLEQAGADYVFDNLKDKKALLQIILGN